MSGRLFCDAREPQGLLRDGLPVRPGRGVGVDRPRPPAAFDGLERAKSREWVYRFDGEKASRICCFIEKLPHIKGDWAKAGGRIRVWL